METKKTIEKLAQAHNFLLTISVKGEDSIAMSSAIVLLRQAIVEMQKPIEDGE